MILFNPFGVGLHYQSQPRMKSGATNILALRAIAQFYAAFTIVAAIISSHGRTSNYDRIQVIVCLEAFILSA
jgi:hypothetical protein